MLLTKQQQGLAAASVCEEEEREGKNKPKSESLFLVSYSRNNNGAVFLWCQLQPFMEIVLPLMVARDARKRR